MYRFSMPKMITNILGIIFIWIGIFLNERIFAAIFKLDEGIQSPLERIVLWVFSISFFVLGYIFIRRKEWIGNIILMLTSLILTYFGADIIFEKLDDGHYSGEKTYISGGGNWGNCYPWVENSRLPIERIVPITGELSNCVLYDQRKRREGYFRKRVQKAALIGDSFTFGEGVIEEDTLGYLLGKKFQKYNFLNFGDSGADVARVHKFFMYILEHRKDIKNILYFYNINDALMSEKIAAEQSEIIDFQNLKWFGERRINSPLSSVLSMSAIYRRLNRVLILRMESKRTIQNYLDMYNRDLNRARLEKTVGLLIDMSNAAKEKKVRFSIVMYPLLYKDLTGNYPFDDIHALLGEICRRNGISFIDLEPAFENHDSFKEFVVHRLDYHPNGLANALVVDYLYRADIKTAISN